MINSPFEASPRYRVPRAPNQFGHAAGGNILTGTAHLIQVPRAFKERPQWRGMHKARFIESPVWETVYAKNAGYEMAWGHILEEKGTRPTFHFIPTRLIEIGVRTEVLAAIASHWFEQHEALFDPYVSWAEGPSCVPFSIRGKCDFVHQWLGQVFLSGYFDSLLKLWEAAADAVIGKDDQSSLRARVGAEPETNEVYVIYMPISAGQKNLTLVLLTADDKGRMCFAMWDQLQGLSASDWIGLPATPNPFVPPTVDFLLDYYRGNGYVVSEARMQLHEPAIANLVSGLIAAANCQFGQAIEACVPVAERV